MPRYPIASNPEVQNQVGQKPVIGADVDSLISKLSSEDHGKAIEQTQNELRSFNYYRVSKRYIPYQVDSNSLDPRFPESFRQVEPN